MSIEDMEGLATTLGVMAALMLSFAVGVFATITLKNIISATTGGHYLLRKTLQKLQRKY